MAIRDIVSRGFGNGTYDPGVNDLPTRGYTIGVPTTPAPSVVYNRQGPVLHYAASPVLHYAATSRPIRHEVSNG